MARTPSQQKMISCGSMIYGSIDIDDFIRLDLKKYESLAVQGVNNSQFLVVCFCRLVVNRRLEL